MAAELGGGVVVEAVEALDASRIRINYRVEAGAGATTGAAGTAFQVWRSADGVADPADELIERIALGHEDSGQAAGRPGGHVATLTLSEALEPEPSRPHVLVTAEGGDASHPAAGFTKRTLGIFVHGGLQSTDSPSPWWTRRVSDALEAEGYDEAFAFGWSPESWTPGAAVKQVGRLLKRLIQVADAMPGEGPIDVHLIGHSQGAVIAAQAARLMPSLGTEEIAQGYLKLTLLDPYAANTAAPGKPYDTTDGFMGWVGRVGIDSYKAMADDPVIMVPPGVDKADVFYQHTPVGLSPSSNGLYELWGQVPVFGTATYYELNGPLLAHSGGSGVPSWWYSHVVPTLGEGGPTPNPGLLAIEEASPVTDASPAITGRAAPGAKVTLLAQEVEASSVPKVIAVTRASGSGDWAVAGTELPAGVYRLIVRGISPTGARWRGSNVFPTAHAGFVISMPGGVENASPRAVERFEQLTERRIGRNVMGMLLDDSPQTTVRPSQRIRALREARGES
jgi:hypothetical protein